MQSTSVEELLEEFEELHDWEERCDLLFDLGMEVPALPEEFKTEENRVHGCQSRVWMASQIEQGDPPRIRLQAESDAKLVNGLIAILLTVYSGKTAAEILETDIKEIFGRIGLDKHLSVARKNGLNGMVKRIQGIAAQVMQAQQ